MPTPATSLFQRTLRWRSAFIPFLAQRLPENAARPEPLIAPAAIVERSPPAGAANAPRPGDRLESLDAFRGACALTVFLTHWFLWANFRPVNEAERLLHDSFATIYEVFCALLWNSGGQHPAVLGFFVLSGFCIHASKARRADAGSSAGEWKRYFSRRARRILPVYWWGTFLGVALIALCVLWPSPNPILAVHATGSLRDLLVRVFAVTAMVPGDVVLGNWSLNTVSSEIAIYALYPLLFVGTRRWGWRPMLILLIVLQFVALSMSAYFPPHWLGGTPLLMAAYWYLGMLAAEWHFKAAPPVSAWVILIPWLAFLALRGLPYSPWAFVITQLMRALVFAVFLLWLVGREARAPAFAQSPLVALPRAVGLVSYSLYAVHPPVIMATTLALGAFPAGRSNTLQLLVTLLATALVTAATYWFIERPYLRSATARPVARDI